MNIKRERLHIVIAGLIIGVIASLLVFFGNPANMGFCIACFLRDTAGGLGLHRAAAVQYIRPEIIGLVLGSFGIALFKGEFSAKGGSAPLTRFVLGFFVMIGCLMFLGCPFRMILRLAGGDLNALLGGLGFVLGILAGVFFLKKGYSLGREHDTNKTAGAVLPALLIIGLCISVFAGVFAVSQAGPGSKHAPVLIALVTALVIGALAQKVRICFAGSVRNIFLMRDFDLMLPIAGLFVVMVVFNLATGGFKLSFDGQPIAHSQHLWNILGLYAVGFGATLAGGCPLRQMTLAGQGSCDAAVTFVGMLIGAAFAHNFGLAGAAASAATAEKAAVLGGPSVAGQIVLACCIVVLFVIAIVNVRKQKNAA